MQAFANVKDEHLQDLIHSTGFYRNKAKNIKGAARKLIAEFGSSVPDNMVDLITIPGIARKSANVILSVWHGKNEGIVVDKQVKRSSQRIGLTKEKTPEKIERDLMKLIPREKWGMFAFCIVDHGRTLCKAPKPKCAKCEIENICPSSSNTPLQ